MDKNTYKELDKICLEEDYQEDIEKYYDSLFGPEDEPITLTPEEYNHKMDLLIGKMKEWRGKLNG